MTPKQHRLRRVMKWTGLAMCVLISAAWLTSLFRSVGYSAYSIPMCGWVSNGRVYSGWVLGDASEWWKPGLHIRSTFYGLPPDRTWPTWMHWGSHFGLDIPRVLWGRGGEISLTFPLWILLFAVGVPTILAWRRERLLRRSDRCSHCGYNLTGTTTGTCPECGDAIFKTRQ